MMASRSRSLINCFRQKTTLYNNLAHKSTTTATVAGQNLLLLNTNRSINYNQQHLINYSVKASTPLILNERSIHSTRRLNADGDITTIVSPAYAESIKEGNITFEKKVGDYVKVDELVAQIETDKTAVEVNSPKEGIIEEILVENGAAIGANTPIIKLKEGSSSGSGKSASTSTKTTPPPPPPPPPTPTHSESVEPPKDLPNIPSKPSSPVTQTPTKNVPIKQAAPKSNTSSSSSNNTSRSTASNDITKISGTRTDTRVKMSKMRQTIARRLKESQETTCMLTTFNEINMSNLIELRKTYGEQFLKKHNLKLGFMSAFVKAASAALQDQPVVNAVIEDKEIVYRDFVDISVAVATPKGLVVPVIRNVEKMNYAEIEKEIASLGERARNNKLAIEDMQGGTFTISNGGVFGSLFGTPIINLPQSSILGMHGVFERPIADKGQVIINCYFSF
jgi:2-oxoglutarate dehydrogenase E2 component (dihydrolipoamide succinyltransferase)